VAPAAAGARTKLSWREARELESLPQRIAALEAEQKTLGERLADPETYRAGQSGEAATLKAMNARFSAIEEELLACLERWESLEARAAGGS
jgi:ATP-binding cassette subfamily F protein uup